MRFRIAVTLLVAGVVASGNAQGRDPKPTLKSVGDQVYCLCGCVTTLNRCPHIPSECSSRAQMEDLIQKGITQGKDETAIVQDLVVRYGVQVLATPPATGFNLAAYILPAVGLVAGLLLLIVIARRWRRLSAQPGKAPAAPVDPKLVAAVEQEIDKILGETRS